MGHIGILVVVVRRLSRRWKVKTRLAGPSPISPMKAEITRTISPIFNRKTHAIVHANRAPSPARDGVRSKGKTRHRL